MSRETIAGPLIEPTSSVGAVVVFEGRVRDVNAGKPVTSLEYEAFGELADIEGRRILHEALLRFHLEAAVCVHRTGHLQLGDVAVRVEAAAGHRSEAFEACRWIIDEIKGHVPIWKKEHYHDGCSEWLDPRSEPSSHMPKSNT